MTGCTTIACNACPRPGACCTGLPLTSSVLDAAETPIEAMVILASISQQHGEDYPFLPLWRVPAENRRFGPWRWRWWCPRLGKDGRCTDYENRPKTCRTFDAGDEVCIYPTDYHNATASVRMRRADQTDGTTVSKPKVVTSP